MHNNNNNIIIYEAVSIDTRWIIQLFQIIDNNSTLRWWMNYNSIPKLVK